MVYHYQNKTPGYDHILQKDCQISNGENSYGKFNSSETVNRINKYFSNKIHFLRCNRMHGLDKFIIHNSHCISSSYHFLHIHIDHIVIEKQREWNERKKKNIISGVPWEFVQKVERSRTLCNGDTFAPSLRLITEADDLVIRHHTENNHHLTPT